MVPCSYSLSTAPATLDRSDPSSPPCEATADRSSVPRGSPSFCKRLASEAIPPDSQIVARTHAKGANICALNINTGDCQHTSPIVADIEGACSTLCRDDSPDPWVQSAHTHGVQGWLGDGHSPLSGRHAPAR